MGCDDIDLGDGAWAIACSRGRGKRKPCSVPGCKNRATKLCDFPLGGGKRGKTCDRDLCDTCATTTRPPGAKDTVDLCPPHAAQKALPGAPFP